MLQNKCVKFPKTWLLLPWAMNLSITLRMLRNLMICSLFVEICVCTMIYSAGEDIA